MDYGNKYPDTTKLCRCVYLSYNCEYLQPTSILNAIRGLTVYSRLHLESTKQTQRLLDTAPFRSMSLGGQWYTSNAFASSSRTDPRALPATDDADGLYQEWLVFSRWLKSEDERIAQEAGLTRPLSLGDTPAAAPSGDPQIAAALYRLRRELEDAIVIEENRAKRAAVERRTHLAPSDAVRQEVRSLPPAPMRTYTLDTEFSGIFSKFNAPSDLYASASTIRPPDTTPSPKASPGGGPQNHSSFGNVSTRSAPHYATSSTPAHSVPFTPATSSKTTPELSSRLSIASLATIALGDSALDWKPLCRKVQVERKPHSGPPASRECDIHWRYNEDAGIAIRSVYRSSEKAKVWTMQTFPATGPSIPLTTAYPDGDVSIDFPRASHGRLDKRCTDIKYIFANQESSSKMQTLLYTNNGVEAAELLFDRCVLTVSSNLNKPECRGKNVRLWRKSEEQDDKVADVLVLLFYTSALPDEQAHWVEEPHYAFQWLTDDACAKSSDKLSLVFSKEPGKWNRDKLFQRRKSSSASVSPVADASPTSRRDSGQSVRSPPASPGMTALLRRDTQTSIVSSTSNLSSRSLFGQRPGRNRVGDLNRFGYSELEIKFKSTSDRKDFIALWQQHVKQLVSLPAKG